MNATLLRHHVSAADVPPSPKALTWRALTNLESHFKPHFIAEAGNKFPRHVAPACLSTLSTVSREMLAAGSQGLTLVHFSAQSEPFLTKKYSLNTP